MSRTALGQVPSFQGRNWRSSVIGHSFKSSVVAIVEPTLFQIITLMLRELFGLTEIDLKASSIWADWLRNDTRKTAEVGPNKIPSKYLT